MAERMTTALVAAVVALSACSSSEPVSQNSLAASADEDPAERAHGFAFSPATYDADGWAQFFDVATDGATLVTWAGDWDELAADEGPAVAIRQLASDHGMDAMAVVGPFSDGTPFGP